jgi:hypothetical protein
MASAHSQAPPSARFAARLRSPFRDVDGFGRFVDSRLKDVDREGLKAVGHR